MGTPEPKLHNSTIHTAHCLDCNWQQTGPGCQTRAKEHSRENAHVTYYLYHNTSRYTPQGPASKRPRVTPK